MRRWGAVERRDTGVEDKPPGNVVEVGVAPVVHLVVRREVRVYEREHDGARVARVDRRPGLEREAQRCGAFVALWTRCTGERSGLWHHNEADEDSFTMRPMIPAPTEAVWVRVKQSFNVRLTRTMTSIPTSCLLAS